MPAEPVRIDRAFVQRVLELSAGDQTGLVRAVEDELAAPLGDDLAHLAHGQREEGHRHAHHHQLGLVLAGKDGKLVQIDFQLVHIERDIEDLHAAQSRPGRRDGCWNARQKAAGRT